MQNLVIPAAARTPAIHFDFSSNHLKVSGESYPEDVTEFYKPVFSVLDVRLVRAVAGLISS
jgi:SiaC family regulatory phosphoprotein